MFLGSISACFPCSSAMASLVTTCTCTETQISNKHHAFCCWGLWEDACCLQRHLCLNRSPVDLVLGHATQYVRCKLFGKSSRTSQVSNSPALLKSGSGINVGQVLLMDCASISNVSLSKIWMWLKTGFDLGKKKKTLSVKL